MESYKDGQSDKNKTRAELRDVDDTYIFNTSSGLYEPKTYSRQNNEHPNPGAVKKRPMFLHVNRDWLTVIISILALAVSIGTLALLGKTVYWAHEQWKQMRATADSAVGQLELAKRPWVRIQGISVSGPLTFTDNANEATFHFTYWVKNTGNSPAMVHIHADILSADYNVDEFQKRMDAACSRAEREVEPFGYKWIWTVIPDQNFGYGMFQTGQTGERTMQGEIGPSMPIKSGTPIDAEIFGCIVYRSTLELNTRPDESLHRTNFFGHITGVDPSGKCPLGGGPIYPIKLSGSVLMSNKFCVIGVNILGAAD
ncbi:MAG TPA: hypothetical protein VK716_13935 [Terracidiphilus sp.]|jgi:hypothetical protein|nr:hypothetical protein [Terracidiphilus sp.]